MNTSISQPMLIATLALSTGGRIGLTFCPGKCYGNAMTGRGRSI